MYLESGLQQVFTCIANAIFRCDSADIDVSRVQQLKNLSKGLAGCIHSVKPRILLHLLVASFVECQFFGGIRKEVLMDFTSVSSRYTMRRPDAAVGDKR